jgi:hypothetical protein
MQLAVFGEASACRGPAPSISQIVESSPHIFIAKVGKRVSDSDYGGVFELLVVEVLKGPVPGIPSVHANELISPLVSCGAMMSGTPFEPVDTGSEWVVSGNLDASRNFVPTSGGSFRLASSQQRLKDEDRKRLLLEFRRVIQLKSKQPTRAAP